MAPRSFAVLSLFALGVTTLAGCSGGSGSGGGDGTPRSDQEAYTVSYRSHVRLPHDGALFDADGFMNQLKNKDPIAPLRCTPDATGPYKDVSAFLGGLTWSHPVSIVKDESYPPLYDGKVAPAAPMAASAGGSDASSASAPVIERPDLIGVTGGVGVFLSKPHGLLAVDARGASPNLSCAMKLPGEPKNFFVQNGQLVVVVNARGNGNRSALLRYAIDGASFRFIDAVKLDDQTVLDARLFDSTIVAYTSWEKPRPPNMNDPTVVQGPVTSGGGGASTGVAMAPGVPASSSPDHRGTKVIVVNWDDQLAIDWQDSLLDDPVKKDPLEGSAPGTQFTANQVVATAKSYASFVAASDRYLAIPRTVQTTRFASYVTTSYEVCTNYNPQYEQVTVCSVQYEQRANPDYQPPNPTTGDYACNGKALADCIQAAAPVVNQYVFVPVGQTCTPVWQGRCETYATKTDTYPTFTTDSETELTIYRFEAGSFTKLDSTLEKMVQKADALEFDKVPLSVTGTVTTRNQIQFQNGHLYVFADNALQTLAVAGNSTSFLNRLDVSARTDSGAAIVFSSDRAMISSASGYNGGPTSTVEMLDLTTPSLPAQLKSFGMPGQTSQLLLADGGILGPGTVQFTDQQVTRSLEKLTLFSRDAGGELDNLLLGTEYDTFSSSYFDPTDDQRIRLDGARLFLPYSGRRHVDPSEPVTHRLNISRIDTGKLVSERSFETSDDIVRTAGLDAQRALAFGNSAAYLLDHTTGDWAISTLKEIFVPFASYRLSDADLYAVISRVGSKCRVTTHTGDANIFVDAPLGQADVGCPESELPIGVHARLLFSTTHTGVDISPDGRTITVLARADVDASMPPPTTSYCRTSDNANGSLVEFLDAVPATIVCEAKE